MFRELHHDLTASLAQSEATDREGLARTSARRKGSEPHSLASRTFALSDWNMRIGFKDF